MLKVIRKSIINAELIILKLFKEKIQYKYLLTTIFFILNSYIFMIENN